LLVVPRISDHLQSSAVGAKSVSHNDGRREALSLQQFPQQLKRGRSVPPWLDKGKGKAAVVGAEYVYCFRAVGMVGRDADLYTRSEIPVPIPSEDERQKPPAEFDLLQHHVKALDHIICNMADVVDMTDELDDAKKKLTKTTTSPTG
jgi:hypothetical protein